MSLYFLLLIVLLQTPTISRSQPMGICKPIDEQSQPPPILSVFHFPPTKSIVFLLKDNFVQSIPVAAFNLTGASLVDGLGLLYPEKVAENRILRCCDEPPAVQYQHIQVLPQGCDPYAMLTIHYRVAIKTGQSAREAATFQNIYAMWQAFSGKKSVVESVDLDSYQRIRRFMCAYGQQCSHITDQVECTGYRFSKGADFRDHVVDVQDLDLVTKDGPNFPLRFSLLSNTSANLLIDKYYTPQKDLFGGQLPVGFILNQTVFLFNLHSSEVYLLRYTTLPSRIMDYGEEAAKPVPIIARSSLAQFFRCPGPNNNNNNNGGGGGSSSSSSSSSSTKQSTPQPHWAHTFAFKLSALIGLVTLFAILTSLLITLCVVAVRNRNWRRPRPRSRSRRTVAGNRRLPPNGRAGEEETSTISRKSSYSPVEGEKRRGGGRGGGGGLYKTPNKIGNRREEVWRSTFNSSSAVSRSSSSTEREHAKMMAAALAASEINANRKKIIGAGGGFEAADKKKKKRARTR